MLCQQTVSSKQLLRRASTAAPVPHNYALVDQVFNSCAKGVCLGPLGIPWQQDGRRRGAGILGNCAGFGRTVGGTRQQQGQRQAVR
jgi:hypothetical protein